MEISPARLSDLQETADLLCEMDSFYGEPEPESAEVKVNRMREVLFGDLPSAFLILARVDRELAGIAAYSFLWPAVGTTRSLYLKELYVRRDHRRRGVAKSLMTRLFDIATKSQCSRVEWTTDRGNVEAKQFYTALGVSVNSDKLFYRFATYQ